ncbi:MAG: M48 family metallopeptidase [Leptospiraceae bacterium]|nr:M48 family metallopeptidase [Leptospiraceae bacterium]MDW8306474.1 SprT family zinc-dependent metalloprotease [Leptospiraceae bacterium]
MTLETIEIIRQKSRKKTLDFHIVEKGFVQVLAPWGVHDKEILQLLQEKKWNLTDSTEVIVKCLPKLEEGAQFLYLGRHFEIHFSRDAKRVTIANGYINIPKSASNYQSGREKLIAWYKKQAKKWIPQRVKELSAIHHFHYGKVRISSAVRRWGSCSTTNNLSFTWRLIQAPPSVIDSVICHELVHTIIKNHARAFKRKLDQIDPDYSRSQKWLKRHALELLSW